MSFNPLFSLPPRSRLLALIAAAWLLWPQQAVSAQGSSGFEALQAQLAEIAASRRIAARNAWEQHGLAYLNKPSKQSLAPLLAAAPEIQEVLLDEIRLRLADHSASGMRTRSDLIAAMAASISPSGADLLLGLIPSLGDLNARAALVASASGGSTAAPVFAFGLLTTGNSPLRRLAASEVLLEFGPVHDAEKWLPLIPLGIADTNLGLALSSYASRPLLPAKLTLPDTFWSITNPELLHGLMELLKAIPNRHAEELVSAVAMDSAAPQELRLLALQVCESSASQFHWRRILRSFTQVLRKREDSLCEDIAWVTHRLGDKAGAKYLLRVPETKLKANPKSWRLQIELATVLVELGNFSRAYKEFHKAVDTVEGTRSYQSIRRNTWLVGARAACGSRHYTDGEDWLSNAQMSSRELAEYIDYPEFEDALRKPGIRKKFGL